MANEDSNDQSPTISVPLQYETAEDHVSVYVDMFNVVRSGREVVLSGYQTLPGYPSDEEPNPATRSRKVTIFLTPDHALELGTILLKRAGKEMVSDREGE